MQQLALHDVPRLQGARVGDGCALYFFCCRCVSFTCQCDSASCFPLFHPQDGVSALGRNYHRDHFVCCYGGCLFEDGVYYIKDDGSGRGERPYCQLHYLDLFVPKCKACDEPVKESGVAACGASWHADHFVCTVCSEPFPDGQFFESEGRPYCAKDYWDTFGKKCAGCDGVIKEQILNALGKTWHPVRVSSVGRQPIAAVAFAWVSSLSCLYILFCF